MCFLLHFFAVFVHFLSLFFCTKFLALAKLKLRAQKTTEKLGSMREIFRGLRGVGFLNPRQQVVIEKGAVLHMFDS